MSDILCKWLNQELRLSKAVEPKTFAKDFSSGYLLGEVLYKYQLQNDFSMFIKNDTSISKLNNFTRLEPTLQLLGIPFSLNTAQDLMQEKRGVATHLLYQLYVSLEKKKRVQNRTVLEMTQPAATAGLHKKELDNYSDLRFGRQRHNSIVPFNQATSIQVPKPPSYSSRYSLKKGLQKLQQHRHQAQVHTEIEQFEINRKKLLITSGFTSSSSGQSLHRNSPAGVSSLDCEIPQIGTKLILQSNSKYMQEIRQRLKEQEQRAKRRGRFLMEQLKAHEAQEEARREEQLVKRLTRPTKQEQRLAAQLLQIRMQKDVIIENRLFRDQQYQQRRERDFSEALQKEAALAQQAKLDHAEEISQELELFKTIAAERYQIKYQKHFKICKDILEQIVDLATKAGENRRLAGLFPEKQMRGWKELLFKGLPLYEPIKGQQNPVEISPPLDPVELLNNKDYDEYTNMVGEWVWPEGEGAPNIPPTNNNILGHIVVRLRNILHPPVMEPSTPSYPQFTLKACVLGKFCSGKTTCLSKITEAHGICVLSADKLIEEALNAYHNGEEVKEEQTDTTNDLDSATQNRDRNIKLSTRAMQGAAAEEELRKGNIISNELLLEIIMEAIRQVSPQSGWILDGFPENITQAHLLEKALGGSVFISNHSENSRTNLAADPNPPEPPPPPAPVLDLALLLDIPDESVVQRAYSHIEKNSAADASSSPIDQTLFLAQIPNRLTVFQESWPKLETWFGEKQNILVRVDANVEGEELYKRVEEILQQLLLKKTDAHEDRLDSGKAPNLSSSATPLPVDQQQALTEEAPVSTEANSGLKEETSLYRSNTQSPEAPSRKVSVCSVTFQEAQGVPSKPPDTTLPDPLSTAWVYVEEPLPPEVPELLCSYWDTVCDSYVNNIKTVMQQLRSHCTLMDCHLFTFSERFKHYLEFPNSMQEFVSQWQKDYNSILDEMREDEETKAELYLRLDELRERLWDISDKRIEQEQSACRCDGWLQDHIAHLTEHHARLMQVELDRFQETICILKVYYSSMCKQLMPEPLLNFVSIPSVTSTLSHPKHTEEGKIMDQSELFKLHLEKFIFQCEEAVKAISNLVSSEIQQWEAKEQSDEDGAVHKSYKEYAAALGHEEKASKVRIALVKGHGLMMLNSLQSRVEWTFTNIKKCLEAHYVAEMNSIDQLTEVVCQHIETGAKLQNPLVLENTDFYINGDYLMFAGTVCPPRPPPLEKPIDSTPTIAQLEWLYYQLYSVAPSGCLSSSDFFRLLMELICVSRGENTLPAPWVTKSETKLMKIEAMLTDHHELIDWRRFLLSAALPWPFPSLAELLLVLQRFKAADNGNTGYINEKQYLQTQLWFSSDGVQSVPEDPSEPLPYDRMTNLKKFLFQLFADHSFSAPLLDYVSMLQYFAAHPNPRQGFIRALSVVLGQPLEHASSDELVMSTPNIEKAKEPSSSDMEDEALCSSSVSVGNQEVSVPAVLSVICHKTTKTQDQDDPNCLCEEEHTECVVNIFRELGYSPDDCVPFDILSQHPVIQYLMESSTHHQFVNIHTVLLADQDTDSSS